MNRKFFKDLKNFLCNRCILILLFGNPACIKRIACQEQNNEDDFIKVQQGTYTGYDFYYSFTKEHNVALQGGYTASYASRVLNPANTIIDSGNVGRGLMLISYGDGNLPVEGFTFGNGKNPSAGDGGGL